MAITKIRGNTQIIDGTITNDQISDSAAISISKLSDGDKILLANGSVSLTSELDVGNNKIINLLTPTLSTDAATKGYVDSVAQGLNSKLSVKVATTENITLSGLQTIDGVELVAGDRVLVKDQDSASENGIYIVVDSDSWTRSGDADSSEKVKSLYTFIEEGDDNHDSGWTLITDDIDLGTTDLVFAQFSGAGMITAGAGLTKTGNEINVVAGDTSLIIGDDSIAVNLSGSTLTVSSGLKVADAGITETQIASSSLSSTGSLQGGNGTKLSIKLDGGSLTSGSNGLKINTAKFIKREIPTGLVDGNNKTFTLAHIPVTDSEEVYLNGILQDNLNNDYDISSDTIVFVDAPFVGDKIRISYTVS